MSCRSRTMIVICLACWVLVEKCWAAKLSATHFNTMDQNTLRPKNQLRTHNMLRSKDWVKITESPDTVISSQLGDRVELNCEAIGSPAPTIRWVQGLTPLAQEAEIEDNSVASEMGLVSGGMAKVRSRLVLDCVMPQHEQTYTCVVAAAGQMAVAAPTMLLVEDSSSANNLTALLSACPSSKASVATITGWSPLYMENMGNDLTLQCATHGKPRPQVYWLDGESKIITSTHPRYTVLPNGDLLIEKLRWSDMGSYTCVATNAHSKDVASTFLYPLQGEEL